ncbi:MAG: acetate--CoA ligase family protein [Balneolaceae bacterium]|nr:acetate--CoA ligase family protein [Balneolaceae bacterium]
MSATLNPFFRPDGIAVIGASRDPHKLGYGVVRNLKEHGYREPVYPVNPTAMEILGLTCYSSPSEVPDPVELAIVIVPAPAVSRTLEQCGERGIRHAVIISGGFSETGKEGEQREEELKKIARKWDMRIIGPNCIGTIDTHTPVNTTFVTGMPETGDIGFCSQSGAMVAAVIDWARGAGVGFSRIASLGNQADVSETEIMEAMWQDRQTRVITAYIEGVSDGRAFLQTMRQASMDKPVVALKGGRGESGARAVASHTGALAGSAEAYDAAFRKCGIQQADSMEEMFDRARALAWQPLPAGRRIAVLTNAGGPAILAVDALEAAGLELAPLSDSTRAFLRSRLPGAASVGNPVDVLAGSGPGTYALALDALLSDDTVDAVAVIQAPQDWFLPESLAEVIGEVAGVHDKPVVASIMGKASVDKALAMLHKRRIPNVSFPERLASVMSALAERREWLDRVQDAPEALPDMRTNASPKPESERPSQKQAGTPSPSHAETPSPSHASFPGEDSWRALLQDYGVELPPEREAGSPEQAVEAAEEIGWPVALKLMSDDVTHKTEMGGVKLHLADGQALQEAWNELETSAARNEVDMRGALVQKMAAECQEVIVGIRRDPQFGPLVLFGTGGTEVELLRDVATAIAPLSEREAARLIDATLAGRRMQGWRGKPAADRRAVIRCLVAMGKLAADHPEIEELEINPLCVMAGNGGAWAVDVRGSCARISSS